MPRQYVAVYLASARTPESLITIPVAEAERKTAFGRELVLVRPVGGGGEAWIAADRLADSPEAAREK